MKKMLILMLAIILGLAAVSCADSGSGQEPGTAEATQQAEKTDDEEESGTGEMTFKINGEEVNVKWEDNESVRALAELATDGPVIVNASKYGGFEQVGGLGSTLPSNDVDTTTGPGDIVLYSSNSIVVFFGTNSWAYTRLGHIEGKSQDELKDMLGGSSVEIEIALR